MGRDAERQGQGRARRVRVASHRAPEEGPSGGGGEREGRAGAIAGPGGRGSGVEGAVGSGGPSGGGTGGLAVTATAGAGEAATGGRDAVAACRRGSTASCRPASVQIRGAEAVGAASLVLSAIPETESVRQQLLLWRRGSDGLRPPSQSCATAATGRSTDEAAVASVQPPIAELVLVRRRPGTSENASPEPDAAARRHSAAGSSRSRSAAGRSASGTLAGRHGRRRRLGSDRRHQLADQGSPKRNRQQFQFEQHENQRKEERDQPIAVEEERSGARPLISRVVGTQEST